VLQIELKAPQVGGQRRPELLVVVDQQQARHSSIIYSQRRTLAA
jgi:hypothetical protein